MEIYVVEVGYTVTRPVIPDEKTSWVMCEASNETEAKLIAAQMAGCHSVMPTSTLIMWEEM